MFFRRNLESLCIFERAGQGRFHVKLSRKIKDLSGRRFGRLSVGIFKTIEEAAEARKPEPREGCKDCEALENIWRLTSE